MKIFRLLYEEAGAQRNLLAALTLIPGITMALVIAVINAVTNYQASAGIEWQLLGLFALGCATVLYTMNRALNMTTRIVAGYISRIRIQISDQVRSLNLTAFEDIGKVRIRNAVGRDLQTIDETSAAVVGLTYFVMQITISAVYVGYLSLVAFGVTMVFLSAAVYFYRRSYKNAEELLERSSRSEIAFQTSFEHLLGGFKEVKLNSERSEDIYSNFIIPRARIVEDLRIRSGRFFNRGQSTSDVFFYFLMGTIVFAVPAYVSDLSVPGKIITVIVFASGAITSIVRMLPVVSRANLAVTNLEKLIADLTDKINEIKARADFEKPHLNTGISLKEICYEYSTEGDERAFSVGPCDVEILAGETVFVVGGNGSGKSTLVKLLTRLYEPSRGQLTWDGNAVTRNTLEAYRGLFSVIFSDFHLFDRLYGVAEPDEERVNGLLREMELGDRVVFENGRFSTTTLSTGQSKRLAMIVALLEERPVYVFDEWAADQDPEFRRKFYESMLADLKEQGRTIIAITHDDRYFHLADRLIWMEEGRIVRVESEAGADVS